MVRPRSESIPASAAIAVPPTPIRCTRFAAAGTLARRAARSESATVDCFHDEVVNFGAELAYSLVVAARMDSISQHRDRGFGFRLDPERSAGESEVTDGIAREQMPGAGSLEFGSVPSERPSRTGDRGIASP